MKTKKYLTQLSDGSGHLNPAPVKKFEKAPDYYGYIKFDDKFLKLSAWVHLKNGKKFLSIRAIETDIEGNPIYINTESPINSI